MTPPEQDYCTILLTKDKVAIIDRQDYESLRRYGWYCMKTKGKYYAARKASEMALHHATLLMHREILGLKLGDKRQGDHGLANTLDNRRFVDGKENLRIATHTENCWNSAKKAYNKLGLKGVSEDKKASRLHPYRARITVDKKEILIGYFATPELAHQAY